MRGSPAIIAMMLGLAACGSGERPFRMVQFCLPDSGQTETMIGMLREVATANRLPFYDKAMEPKRISTRPQKSSVI
jgi:hypothetical protein